MKGFSIIDAPDVVRLNNAIDMIDKSIGELRRLSHHIMPESLMRYGLKVSLENFCRAIPKADFKYFGEDARFDSRLEILVYRCAYELVNNAVKYSGAENINVQLIVDDSLVALTVYDNGIGFNPETVTYGSGLKDIKTRISAYNGNMNIHSSPEKGTEINIEIEL